MYGKELSLEEIKSIELDILKYVKKVCEENNLRYFLCGGTLLGAVRHKGFIPWDDDIDIALPRDDYLKLIKILDDGHRYRSLSVYNNEDYYYPFAKIVDTNTILENDNLYPLKELGVYIDVFPIDGLPQKSKKINYHLTKLIILRKLLYLSRIRNCYKSRRGIILNLLVYVIWFFSRMIGWRRWISIIEKLATKYEYNNSEKVGCVVAGYGKREIMNKEVFEEIIYLEFEGDFFSAPIGYDKYLTNLYGDYMQLPPENKRVSKHGFKAYMK